MSSILFVTHYTGLGGGETALMTLAEQLPNHLPHLLVPAEGALAERWRANGWPVHVSPWRGATLYFIPGLWARLPISHTITHLIHEHQISIVHSDYHTLPMALPAAHRAGVRCIWTCMGWWFKPKPWQRRFFQQADATFAHSEAIKSGFLGDPPFMNPDAIDVLYPGVDTERFHPGVDGGPVREAAGITPHAPVVAMIARFQDVKGHDTFLQMAGIVMRRIPEVRFIVAGENLQSAKDSTYHQHILKIAQREKSLWERLIYVGHRDDVERVLAAADVVVCPSHFESFGMVNVEAMASGKAVVSTNRGGPSEVVVDGVTGYLVPPKDPKALADRVIELLHSPKTRQSFGVAGRMRAVQVFSATVSAQKFQKRIESLR